MNNYMMRNNYMTNNYMMTKDKTSNNVIARHNAIIILLRNNPRKVFFVSIKDLSNFSKEKLLI